ncbi:hypothetical protein BDN71DRAFT_1507545 [Pleurotus eryngii]|uniref:Uncharacterized protein n=1 Tax=Pleurotus eryngii TaxID=5323 RepID=A0A9P5ZU66_PLEER|nr:hypothetical protein BDN71DRAFT_1507545 [Pleurotus eryngii]
MSISLTLTTGATDAQKAILAELTSLNALKELDNVLNQGKFVLNEALIQSHPDQRPLDEAFVLDLIVKVQNQHLTPHGGNEIIVVDKGSMYAGERSMHAAIASDHPVNGNGDVVEFWVLDGQHRLEALRRAHHKFIHATVYHEDFLLMNSSLLKQFMASKNDELIQNPLSSVDRLKVVTPLIAVAYSKHRLNDIDEALLTHVSSGKTGYIPFMLIMKNLLHDGPLLWGELDPKVMTNMLDIFFKTRNFPLVVFFLKACWHWVKLTGDEYMHVIVAALQSVPSNKLKAKAAVGLGTRAAFTALLNIKSGKNDVKMALGGMDFWNADGMDKALAEKKEMQGFVPLDKDICLWPQIFHYQSPSYPINYPIAIFKHVNVPLRMLLVVFGGILPLPKLSGKINNHTSFTEADLNIHCLPHAVLYHCSAYLKIQTLNPDILNASLVSHGLLLMINLEQALQSLLDTPLSILINWILGSVHSLNLTQLEGLSLAPLITAFTTLITTNTPWHTFLTEDLEVKFNISIPTSNTNLHWSLPLETPDGRRVRLAQEEKKQEEAKQEERRARILKEKREKEVAETQARVQAQSKAVRALEYSAPNKEEVLRRFEEKLEAKRKQLEQDIQNQWDEVKKTKAELAQNTEKLQALITSTQKAAQSEAEDSEQDDPLFDTSGIANTNLGLETNQRGLETVDILALDKGKGKEKAAARPRPKLKHKSSSSKPFTTFAPKSTPHGIIHLPTTTNITHEVIDLTDLTSLVNPNANWEGKGLRRYYRQGQ